MENAKTWELIHRERAAVADTLEELKADQWAEASLCGGWSVKLAAAHILAGAEQTRMGFATGMAGTGFRFNTMIDRDARKLGVLSTAEIIERLRARTATTNGPPAPVMTMLGEVVIHAGDIRYPLGLAGDSSPEAIGACLDMYKGTGFPVGTKKRISGLRLVATDCGWSDGTGPEVTGPALPLLLAMTGRPAGLAGLGGAGLDTLRIRMAPTV
ncbi:MAG TPA: maleylpyruvate isomerase family mycothiol-dependent enzyme [Acidimicrobiia bacterium]|nr:maleylpyruvate isomerase family mycothiol-dependent enzyme [Acidimicrobiia bacterium]